jgi:hypothetical protein
MVRVREGLIVAITLIPGREARALHPGSLRASGGAFFPWLLWSLLLSAVVFFLRR